MRRLLHQKLIAAAVGLLLTACLPLPCGARHTVMADVSPMPRPVDGICLITDTVDLGGITLRLEKGLTLRFRDRGIITHGILMGDSTRVEADSMAYIFHHSLKMGGSWDVRAARPEWFGAKGDGIAYYDRPLRCFNGHVGDVEVMPRASGVTVSYPASRIVDTDVWQCAPAHTTSQVVYCPRRQCFLLCDGGRYYNRWDNSHEWNDATGHARTDVVFSDLQTRLSTVYAGGVMTDIDSTMTDDTKAIRRAIFLGNGDVRLRPTIYYSLAYPSKAPKDSPWRDRQGFCFEGNGATLFVRARETGLFEKASYSTWAWMLHCSDGVFRNLHFRALRDRDAGAPKGHRRFSSSDSHYAAFGIFACQRLRFEHLTFKNMMDDFLTKVDFGISNDIRIDHWTSEDFTENVFGGIRQCHINHARLRQADLIGDGMHVFYGLGMLRQFYVSDSHISTGGPMTSVMLTFHGGGPGRFPDSIYFDRCVIEGARLLQGQGYQHQTYRHCTLRTTFNKQLFAKGAFRAIDHAIIGTRVNFTFEDCKFELNKMSLLLSAYIAEKPPLRLDMRNCSVVAKDNRLPLIQMPFDVSISHCDIRCEGDVVKTSGLATDHVSITGSSIACGGQLVVAGKTPAANIRLSNNRVTTKNIKKQ